MSIFVGPQYIVSVRRDAQVGFTEVRRRCEREPELLQHGPAYVLYALMDNVVDRYFPVLDALTAEIEDVEERIFAGQTTRAQIEALYLLKRKLMTLDHATQPLLEVAGKLYGGRVPPICAGLHDYFRDVYDHLLRLKQTIDNLRDMVTTAITVNLSLITIQENEVDEAPGRLRGAGRRADDGCRRLRHEFQQHARAGMAVWLSGCGGLDGGDRRVSRVSLQESEMDVIPPPPGLRGTRADALCFASARELAGQIRDGQVSAREVMAAFLSQINRLNPHLNAIVAKLDDDACLELADAADRALARGYAIGPLHGLPTAFKDLESAIGFPFTKGSPIYKDVVGTEDTLLVERIKHAGAIPIGKTNVPEFGMGSHTYNTVYGTTRNPYDRTKSAGGSSGGAAPRWRRACCPSRTAATLAGR